MKPPADRSHFSILPRLATALALVTAMLALLAATAGSAGAQVQIGLNFTGRVNSPPPAPAYWPDRPDTMGAVGEQHIVELLNDGYAVYRKSDGALLQSTSTLDEFWNAAGVTSLVGVSFDPRILYDAASQRWFAVSVDGGMVSELRTDPNSCLVAVSKSADPTQGWTGFQIDNDPTDTSWGDFPQLGMDAQGLYVAITRLGATAGQSLLVLPKADLLAATPSIANATKWLNLTPFQVGLDPTPVVNFDGTGLPATLLSGSNAPMRFLTSTEIGGSIGSPVLASSEYIPVPANNAAFPIHGPQPGPKADISAALYPWFSGNAVQVGGSIWAAQSTQVDGRAAVRWYEIDAATDILLQSGDLKHPTLDLYYPSIAVNEFDQVVIGMSGSSEQDFVGAYAAVGETLGGVTSFGDPLLLQAGLADFARINLYNGRNNWGDYSATVVDPSDPHRFWTFQEYVETEDTYGVHITELILIPEPSTGLLLLTGLGGLALRHRRRG